jgi:type II secretory pathway pseudopilin PulG
VELLVVIAIIGILIALLLPAAQAAREAARRSQCSNNLKQLGLALHNYHDTFGCFPSAFVRANSGNAAANNDQNLWGWSALILPFVEQTALHDQLDPSTNPMEVVTAALLNGTSLGIMSEERDTFRCPSDVGPVANTLRDQYPWSAGGNSGRPATSNYVAVIDSWRTSEVGPNGVCRGQYARASEGIFRENGDTKIRDIRDGTSNTLAVGERRWDMKMENGSLYTVGAATVFGVRRRNHQTHRADQVGCGCPGINGNAWANRGRTRQGFSSEHPGGAAFALADGSVRFISETIDFDGGGDGRTCADDTNLCDTDTTWERLIAIRDGQPVGDF